MTERVPRSRAQRSPRFAALGAALFAASCASFTGAPGPSDAGSAPEAAPPTDREASIDGGSEASDGSDGSDGPDGPDGSDGSSCGATSAGTFDPAFGAAGRLDLPGTHGVAALGQGATVLVASREPCAAGVLAARLSLRQVPVDGRSEGVVVRCFADELEEPVSLHGDPTSGYVLATTSDGRARLRFLDGSAADRQAPLTLPTVSIPAFALRVRTATGPLDVWGHYSFAPGTGFSNPSVGFPGGAQAPTTADEVPVAADAYDDAIVVAFLRRADAGAPTLVVRRFAVSAVGFAEDGSFAKRELPLSPDVSPTLFGQSTLHAELGATIVGYGVNEAVSALVLRDTVTQPLVPTVGTFQPRVTRRCDGTLAMAHYVAQTGSGGDIVVTRYKANQALDPSFRAVSPSATPPTFLLRAPDESLLVGTSSAKGTSIRRVVP